MLLYFVMAGLMVLALGWLSGYDSNLTGENRRKDFIRRAIRCGVTLVLLAVCLWLPPAVILIAVILAIIWAGCLAELFSHGFRRLAFPELYDDRTCDTPKEQRHLDALAHLIRTGRRDDAIKLCGEFQRSGEVNPVTLEATLEYLGEKPERASFSKPLADAAQRRSSGDFSGAEQRLRLLLAANPENLAAAMALMRLYAQDLHQSGKAAEVLRRLEKQPHVPAGYIEFARRSIVESSVPAKAVAVSPRVASVDELLAGGSLGTAIEMLEAQIRLQPGDFDLRLKLAEAHGRHCGNLDRAEKIIHEIEADASFSPDQVRRAQNRLQAWRSAGPSRMA